ncbi:MAG: hypothetical protein N2D54_10795 [Chloroflexota bacterium]
MLVHSGCPLTTTDDEYRHTALNRVAVTAPRQGTHYELVSGVASRWVPHLDPGAS